jgi:DNA-binding NtrC family response regulator
VALPDPCVLVVDDDPSIRLLCRVNLEFEGIPVVEAETLEEARDSLRAGGVGVVLLDVNVGEDDGRDLLDELKSDFPELPVLMLTGTVEFVQVRHAPDGIIPKPFDPERMVERVREALPSAGATRSQA